LEPDFEKLSFEKAVQLFKGWGFLVERGPRPEELTLILEGPNHRSCCVCQPEQLMEMAATILVHRCDIGPCRRRSKKLRLYHGQTVFLIGSERWDIDGQEI